MKCLSPKLIFNFVPSMAGLASVLVRFLPEPHVRALVVSGNHTAVCISAMLGTAATTRYLLDCGADPTVAGSMGTALHGAVLNGMHQSHSSMEDFCFLNARNLSPGAMEIEH
jgi:ankyrin repeat protein